MRRHPIADPAMAISLASLCLTLAAPAAFADFDIAFTTGVEVGPDIVYNSVEDEYLAAWIDVDSGVAPAVMLQRLDPATGSKIGLPVSVLAPGVIPYAPSWKPILSYSPASNSYVVAVNVTFGAGIYDNFLLIGSFNGTTLAEIERVSLFIASDFYDDFPDGNKIGLTYNELDDEFLVTYIRKIVAGLELHWVISTQRYEVGGGMVGVETDLINSGVNGIGSLAMGYSTFIAEFNPPDPPVMGSTFLLATHGGFSDELSLFLVDPSGTVALSIPFSSGSGAGASAPAIAAGRVAGMTHDHWLVTWVDINNLCGSGGQQYIENCADGTPWSGIYGSYFDPWRFSYGPGPENVTFPISILPSYSEFRGVDVAYNENDGAAKDGAFHVVWQAVPIDDPQNDESLSHIRMNSVDSFLTSYPAPWPFTNHVVSDVTGSCPAPPAACVSDTDPILPAIATASGAGGLVAWEQLYPPNPVDHDIFGDLVQFVPEPGLFSSLASGFGLLMVLERRRRS